MIEGWERWWFPARSGLDLAVCRILVVGAQLAVFMPFFMATPGEHVALIERGGGFEDAQWMARAAAAILPAGSAAWPTLIRVAYATTVAAGLTTLLGVRTRASAFVFAAGTWFLVSHEGSYGEVHHTDVLVSLFLLFLAFSPSGKRLSVDAALQRKAEDAPTDRAAWPLRLTQVLLAWSYFSNAVAKLAYSGLEWMNGYTLQQQLLSTSIQWDRPLGVWLARQHSTCVALSIGTLAFELLFPLALVWRRARTVLLAAGVAFHVLILLAMNVAFLQHIVLYAVFVDFERWGAPRRRSARLRATSAA